MLQGVLPVLPTPFDREGRVDPDAMRRVVAFALRCGVDGMVFPGFASEVDELTDEERTRLLHVVVEAVSGRVPVVAGASAPSAPQAIRLGRAAAEAGVTTLMIQAPKAIGSNRAAVTAFYAEVAASVPGAEIILQNAPVPRGSDLTPETILAAVRDVPLIRYVKEETVPSGPAITALLRDRPPHLEGVMGGGGARYIIEEYARGACGAMPALEIADIHVALDCAYRGGDIARARALYAATLPLLVIQAVYRMRLTKLVLMRRGVLETAVVRADGPALDEPAIAEIDASLAMLGDLLGEAAEGVPA